MKPSEALEQHRETIREILSRYPVANPRIFGSVARGEDTETSDLDIIVEGNAGLTIFDLMELEEELGLAAGTKVDVRTRGDFSERIYRRLEKSFRHL